MFFKVIFSLSCSFSHNKEYLLEHTKFHFGDFCQICLLLLITVTRNWNHASCLNLTVDKNWLLFFEEMLLLRLKAWKFKKSRTYWLIHSVESIINKNFRFGKKMKSRYALFFPDMNPVQFNYFFLLLTNNPQIIVLTIMMSQSLRWKGTKTIAISSNNRFTVI